MSVLELPPEVINLFPKNDAEKELLKQFRQACQNVKKDGKQNTLVIQLNKMRGKALVVRIFDTKQINSSINNID